MGEVGCVTQQRVEITHNGNDGSSLGVTLLAVLDEKELVDHLVNVAAILGKIEFATCVIVIFFHKKQKDKGSPESQNDNSMGQKCHLFGRQE